jgi:hypothetical protein
MQVLTPLAGPGALALFDRKPNEGDAEGVDRLFAPFGALVQRLVQDVVVRAAQAPADDLLGQQRRAEGA